MATTRSIKPGLSMDNGGHAGSRVGPRAGAAAGRPAADAAVRKPAADQLSGVALLDETSDTEG
jgi:hypothetical protein